MNRQHKYLLASVDVKNPQANFDELENSVPPEESNDELLDQAWDDHTGESSDAKKVKEARQLEMEYYDKMHVFDKVPTAQCWERTGKAHLKARWVDFDKGTRYRSRWVAKQFKGSDSEEWFAATPPIEALRALISHTTKKKALMVCDVSRAFFYDPVQHEIYVELCEEAKNTVEDNNMCAKLRMSMYGTKDAAQNWQKKVLETMATLGFSIGKASPVHPQRSLKCLVHGDDFVVSGEPVDLVWVRNELESKLEINTTILGDEPGMSKEVKILNRKLCWHDGVGVSCEADRKHAKAIFRETGVSSLTSLKITMSKENKEEVRDKTDDIVEKRKLGKLGMKEQPLIGQIPNPVETTRYRALVATANFLAIDRGDIVYCAKELPRHRATPTTADWEKMVRLERYLKKRPRVKLWYKFQETPCQLETFSDTNWAGCRRTRRSTTGGYTIAGSHLIKMWCKIQAVVALSSAEAELYGLVRASAETMGLIPMYKDLGTHMNGVVLGDANEALATVARRGLCKLRHLDTNYLWIQEKAAKGDLNFKKVAGVDNGADLFTKTLWWNEIQSHIYKLSSQFVQNEINVTYVGARPNGVNLPRIRQELGVAGDKSGSMDSNRHELSNETHNYEKWTCME